VFFLLDLAAWLDLEAIDFAYCNKDPRGDKAYGPGLIQSLPQCLLPGLRAWFEVGVIAPFPCLKAPLPQPISTWSAI